MQHCTAPTPMKHNHQAYVEEPMVPLTSRRRECSVRPSLRPAVWHGRPDDCTAERSRRTGYCSLLLPVACCHRGVHCTLQLESSDARDPSDPRSGPAGGGTAPGLGVFPVISRESVLSRHYAASDTISYRQTSDKASQCQ